MAAPLLDVLAIAAHPDDAELFAGGTLARIAAAGHRVAILNLTRGESASVGTPETRAAEAARAAEILGCCAPPENLGLDDGALANTDAQRRPLVAALRSRRPRLVLTHGAADRHPDHPATHALVRDAIFFANVGGYSVEPNTAPRWKVEALACWQGNTFQPDPRADWVVDISAEWEVKLSALRAYATQFRGEAGAAAQTYIGSAEFWAQLERRAAAWGHLIGAGHAEAFTLDRPAHAAHPLIQYTR